MDISISIRLGNPNDCQRLVPGADHAPERSNSTWKCIAAGAKERDEAWILTESNSMWEDELIVSSLESCWNYVLHGFSIVSNIYCTHYSTVLYSLIDWFFLRSASPPAPPKSRMKVTSALPSAKLVPQNNGCLENPKWCLTYGPLYLKFGQQAFFSFSKQAYSPSSSIIKIKMTYIVMWEFSKMMDPKKCPH